MSVINFRKHLDQEVALLCNKFVYTGVLKEAGDSFLTLAPPVAMNVVNAPGFRNVKKSEDGKEVTELSHLRPALIETRGPVYVSPSSVEALFIIPHEPEPPAAV